MSSEERGHDGQRDSNGPQEEQPGLPRKTRNHSSTEGPTRDAARSQASLIPRRPTGCQRLRRWMLRIRGFRGTSEGSLIVAHCYEEDGNCAQSEAERKMRRADIGSKEKRDSQ